MYIDKAREADLRILTAEINDDTQPRHLRQRAYKVKQKILHQLRDKKLASLRERLLKASAANDEWETWKITNQIKDHLKEERIDWWSTKRERV